MYTCSLQAIERHFQLRVAAILHDGRELASRYTAPHSLAGEHLRMRQHTCIRAENVSAYVSVHMSAYVSIRQHTASPPGW